MSGHQRALEQLRERVRRGETVSVEKLAEARALADAEAEMAALRSEARQCAAAEAASPDGQRRQAHVDRLERQRRAAAEHSREAEREGWRRAIQRGLDPDYERSLRDHPERHDPEFVELWRELRQPTGVGR